jgi:hypothetical protein
MYHKPMTLDEAIAKLPDNANEGDQKHFPGCIDKAGHIFTAIFGFYGGRWQRFTGRATRESGIEYNDFQPV